jgi:hypothetical protein
VPAVYSIVANLILRNIYNFFVRESLQKVQLRQIDSLCKNFAELDAEFVSVEKVAKLLCEKSYQ